MKDLCWAALTSLDSALPFLLVGAECISNAQEYIHSESLLESY